MEISLGEVFAWLNAPCASENEETEKRGALDILLADDALAREHPNLRRLQFDIAASSPWPSSDKLAEALRLNAAAAQEGAEFADRPGLLGDAMRACHEVDAPIRRRVLELEIDLHEAWIARVERNSDSPPTIAQAADPRYKTAALYNGYGATLYGLHQMDAEPSLLRRADAVLNKAEGLLQPSDPPEALLQVLANRLYVWASLGQWDACKARAKDFDDAVEALRREKPGLAAHPVFRSRTIKAKGATALGVFHTAPPAEALRRFEQIDGRETQTSPAQTQDLAVFMASPDFPAIAFVRRAEVVEALLLPGVSRNSVLKMLAERWLPAYSKLRQRQVGPFRDAIDVVSAGLSEVFAPAAALLSPKTSILRLSVSDVLAYLPFHLIDVGGRTLLERWEVRYIAPSGGREHVGEMVAKDMVAKDDERRTLIVENPREDLPCATVEAQAVHRFFENPRELRGRKATTAALVAAMGEMGGVDYFHFAGHAAHAWSDDEKAYLALANGERWTAPQIAAEARMRPGALVVLSACEAGVPDSYRIPYDFSSLARAFIQAGARGVISALWPVRDDATARLMKRFYELHLAGAHPAAALRAAQLWLRDSNEATLLESQEALARSLRSGDEEQGWGVEEDEEDLKSDRPYAHPYFWAGFVYTEA